MTTLAAAHPSQSASLRPLKPLPLRQAVILFAVPAAGLALAVYWLWPALTQLGVPKVDARYYVSTLFMACLLVVALAAYVLEGNPLNWAAFTTRYRLGRMGWREWLWTLGAFLVMGLLSLAAMSLLPAIWRALNFVPPEAYIEGAPALWLTLLNLTINILGEELWWRGFILPRQELVHGRLTWLVHGILWALFHLYKWWSVPAMFITCLVIPFVAQRVKNTWPGIFVHFGINGAGILLSVLGG
jgi:membrane protease YdiL (CAAX protease family)